MELKGIEGVQAISTGTVDFGVDGEEILAVARGVFFNSLMHAACEEVIAYFASSGDMQFALSETRGRYWMDDKAYVSYFFNPRWKTAEFFEQTVGASGQHCVGMLHDEGWYRRDKQEYSRGKR